MRFGEVCDISVIGDRENFERARQLVGGGELYLPSATYSWLARDRLISVRSRAVSYSLVSQFVRDGQLLVVYLPEVLDELSRRLLFEAEHEVPLTDLRALMLAAHLKVPYLSFGEEPLEQLQEHFGAKVFGQLEVSGGWRGFKEALGAYRELAADVGAKVGECISNGGSFDEVVKDFGGDGQKRGNGGATNGLEFRCVAWDLTPILKEYLGDRVVQPETVQELCERSLLLVASPRQ
ncbi:MAG: hypothetical protein AB1305_01375 [Candidatus Hadarchaeota archaeon]